jgi:hypothetical protein
LTPSSSASSARWRRQSAEADAASDAALLKSRVSGAAANLRSGGYAVRSKADDVPAPVPVAASPVLTRMIPSGTAWPRTVVALTQGEKNPVPQALVLTQDTPPLELPACFGDPDAPRHNLPGVNPGQGAH